MANNKNYKLVGLLLFFFFAITTVSAVEFVIVGNTGGFGGEIVTTENGLDFIDVTPSGASDLFSVGYSRADDLWVAVGEPTTIWYSSDGTTWSAENTGMPNNNQDVAYSETNDLWIVGGGDKLAVSSDGSSFVVSDSTAFSFYGFAVNTTYPGCTDSGALNYNSLVNSDDGSCTYPGSGYGGITYPSQVEEPTSTSQENKTVEENETIVTASSTTFNDFLAGVIEEPTNFFVLSSENNDNPSSMFGIIVFVWVFFVSLGFMVSYSNPRKKKSYKRNRTIWQIIFSIIIATIVILLIKYFVMMWGL